MPTTTKQLIRVGHSPDPDDAFMFYALAGGRIDTGRYEFRHELVDIETLNRRALAGELELTAVSIHAYAYLTDKYVLCPCGASMGDRYGPMVVATRQLSLDQLRGLTIAVPGAMTTAYLALCLCLGWERGRESFSEIRAPTSVRVGENDSRPRYFQHVVVPFDRIIDAAVAGQYEGQPVDAGLIIHEGQLTYGDRGLTSAVDLGQWWFERTGLPLPLGGNVLRRDLGSDTIREVNRLLHQSIRYGLDHRAEALQYALQYGRDLDRTQADRFVGMYVNDWTLDFGPRGREAVRRLLADGHSAGLIPHPVEPEFVEH